MKKIDKKAAGLAALQLGTALSPLTVLTQASADTLEDTLTKAQTAGVTVKVEDKGDVKVSSKQEADVKNAEADAQLKADALQVSKAIDDYTVKKAEVQKANQDVQTRYESEVKAEEERVTKLEVENAKVEAQNSEAQKAYEAEKAKVEAQNTEAQKAYEAEKAKVEAQNAESLKAYETEKAKVEAQNTEKLRAYETELANTKAENAKLLAQYEAALQKAKDAAANKQSVDDEIAKIKAENEKAQKAYEAELARVTAERDHLTKQYEADKARIEKENADTTKASTDEAAKIEADYQAALVAYNQKVQEITANNQKAQADYETAKKAVEAKNAKIDADYAAAQKAYEAKLAEVTASNKAKQAAYDKALADYKAGKLDTVTNKEKTLTMDVPQAPTGVTVKPARTIEKDLTNSTNLEADLKAAEAEFEAEKTKVTAKLNEYAEASASNSAARDLLTKELATSKEWEANQNKLGNPLGIKYVLREHVVTGDDATVSALKTAYDRVKAQMDNEALVGSTTGIISSKNPFIKKWVNIKQTYGLFTSKSDTNSAMAENKQLTLVDYDLTQLEGYEQARQTKATGSLYGTDLPAEVQAWANASDTKRRELVAEGVERDLRSARATSGSQVIDPATYKVKVDEFNKNLSTLQAQVNEYNTSRQNALTNVLAADLNKTLSDPTITGYRVINNNNMQFTPSSNRVKYLRSRDFTTLDDASKYAFDSADSANSESPTPVENQLGTVKFMAVRIPKGESVTVEYTRKDGKNYLDADSGTRSIAFVRDEDYSKKDTFTSSDGQALNKIRYTIRNDESFSSDGDIIALFTNDTAMPSYYGVSNWGSPNRGIGRFRRLDDPRLIHGITTTTAFLNSRNELLRPTVNALDIVYPDQTDPSTFQLQYGKRFIKGTLPSVGDAPVEEFIERMDIASAVWNHGLIGHSVYAPSSEFTDLPANWKDTKGWMVRQVGWDGAKLVSNQKSFNKDDVDKAMSTATGVTWRVGNSQTGFFDSARVANFEKPTVTFPYRRQATYTSVRPVGETVRTIDIPVVRHSDASTAPREVTPVKMVIKYKEVKPGVEPTRPTLEQEPVTPPKVNKDPLPTAPIPTPLPEKPVKGQVTPNTTKPLPDEPKLPELPKKPEPKPLPNPGTVVVEPKKPELKQDPVKPTPTPEPKKPVPLTPPTTPQPKDAPKPPVTKPVPKVERKVIEKPKLQEDPKAPELQLNKVHYIYEPKTIWVTVDGKVLRNWEDGEKPKDTFNGYEYVRTEKDKDGNIRHIYKEVEKPQEQPKVKTIWVTVDGQVLRNWEDGEKPKDTFNGYEYVRTEKDKDGNIRHIYNPIKKVTTIWVTITGEVLKPRTDGEQPKEHFDGYEFVRTDKDKDGNTTHIYRPVEKPVKKVTTIWVTEKGQVLKPRTDGEHPKENFDGYEFVRTDKDKDGNTTHIYKPVKKVTTIWVTEKGQVLKPRTDGEHPKENFDGYEFVRTDKDKDGNTTHIYRKVEKPVKKVTTIWVTEKGQVLKPRTDGEHPKENFDGYEFVRTDKDKDSNTTHIYRKVEKPVKKVTTIWVTEKGQVLKPRTDGEHPKENFDGYEFVRTDKDKDGNISHIYRKVEKPVKKVTTIWATEKGEVLKPRTDGEQPKENFDGYEFVRTDKDKDGNISHIYKPVKKVTTIWVTETGEVLKPRTDGEQPKVDFDGYEFVRTDKDKDGNISHIYRKVEKPVKKVTTIWVTEKGEVLKPRTDGEQPKVDFDGYEFVRTDKDKDGNISHIYRKVEKPKVERKDDKLVYQPQTAKELPKTGDTGTLVGILGGLLAGGGLAGLKRKKRQK